MHLTLENAIDEQTHYFGVSDFQVHEDGDVTVWFHDSVSFLDDQLSIQQTASVVSAVSESGYDKVGAYETIGDLCADFDASVYVVTSPHYPATKQAIGVLEDEGIAECIDDYE